MTVEQLNEAFGISGQVRVVEGAGGFPVVEVSNEKGSAKVSVYSAQVLSFLPVGEELDVLFVSEKAYYQAGKATKGGIPICWPWFGPDPEGLGRASHGFVRNRMWSLLGTEAVSAGETKVRLGMTADDETKAIWPKSFELVMEVLVGAQLSVSLMTRNTGNESFEITQAFHAYFNIGNIEQVKVLGLENVAYIDKVEKVEGGAEKTQTGAVTIFEEVDRIYTGVRPELVIEDDALGRRIRISTTGSETAIVWNPWKEISAKMADLADDSYQRFICVETANAADEVITVSAGGRYELKAVYSVERG